MRAGTTYRCEHCRLFGVERSRLCAPTCREPRDENGNPQPPASGTYEWFKGVPERVVPSLVQPFFLLAMALKRSRRRKKLRRLLDAAGDPVPISAAPEGLCRVDGRVHVLSPVDGPDGPCAAYVTRRVWSEERNPQLTIEKVTVARSSGRFLVRDATGVALVDDDFMRLFDERGEEPDPAKDLPLVVRDGDTVTVVGHAFRGGLGEVAASALGTLRGPPTAVRFEGGAGRPLCVFVPPAGDV